MILPLPELLEIFVIVTPQTYQQVQLFFAVIDEEKLK